MRALIWPKALSANTDRRAVSYQARATLRMNSSSADDLGDFNRLIPSRITPLADWVNGVPGYQPGYQLGGIINIAPVHTTKHTAATMNV